MEQLINCEFLLDIELIETISGGNQEFSIEFTCTDKKRYKLIFDRVWDLRYSIETGCIDRFCRFRENLFEGLIENSIYIVEDSEYIKHFKFQASGTCDEDHITDYLMYDSIDTIIEVLTLKPPKLIELN